MSGQHHRLPDREEPAYRFAPRGGRIMEARDKGTLTDDEKAMMSAVAGDGFFSSPEAAAEAKRLLDERMATPGSRRAFYLFCRGDGESA